MAARECHVKKKQKKKGFTSVFIALPQVSHSRRPPSHFTLAHSCGEGRETERERLQLCAASHTPSFESRRGTERRHHGRRLTTLLLLVLLGPCPALVSSTFRFSLQPGRSRAPPLPPPRPHGLWGAGRVGAAGDPAAVRRRRVFFIRR